MSLNVPTKEEMLQFLDDTRREVKEHENDLEYLQKIYPKLLMASWIEQAVNKSAYQEQTLKRLEHDAATATDPKIKTEYLKTAKLIRTGKLAVT